MPQLFKHLIVTAKLLPLLLLVNFLTSSGNISVTTSFSNSVTTSVTTSVIGQQREQEQQRPRRTQPSIVSTVDLPLPTASQSTTAPGSINIIPAPDTLQEEPTLQSPQGLYVQTLDGRTVTEQAADQLFNPASAIKLATALAALRTFGPQHRFATVVWTTGSLDSATGTVTGDLFISGRDPSFHDEHAMNLAGELNRAGIRTVTGDLIVAPRFTMNFDSSAQRSGERFYDTLDVARRPAAATRAWLAERATSGAPVNFQNTPSVAVMGAVYIESVPKEARLLLTHRSSTLVDVLKVLLCYSNNFMAERLGDALGGPLSIERTLMGAAGVRRSDIMMTTASGLGTNRITPRAMMRVYQSLLRELAKNGLSPSDIMPVAGIDPGTLRKRYTVYPSRGSVIGKTGTLPRTDGGVSALVGQMRAQNGETLLFVIFNQRGSVVRFRREQDQLVTNLQNMRGGPAAFIYTPQTLAMRLANTELNPATPARKEEYEPTAN